MNCLYVLCILAVLLLVLRYSTRTRFEGFEGSKEVVICKASWCGHCKDAAPEFEKLVSASPITLQNGSKATVKMLDADEDKEDIAKYSVRGYPTILIMNGGQKTEYPGERTSSGVIEFLNSM
jgi:thiol-disulfide isomerase/thioredoxin